MFVESCDFEEENICGMIQGAGNKKWERQASVDGGPQTDFSNMGKCKGDCQPSTCLVPEMNINRNAPENERSARSSSQWFSYV